MFLQMMCHAGKPAEKQKKWQKNGKKCHFNIQKTDKTAVFYHFTN